MDDSDLRRIQGDDQLDLFPEATKPNNRFFYKIAAVVVILAALFVAFPSFAEEILPPVNPEGYRDQAAHARDHQLYAKMHNQTGTHCCNAGENGGDCRPTTARWNEAEKVWEAKLDGFWVKIAQSRHVKDAYGLNEFATVCADTTGYLFCFIPPNSGF